MKPLSLAFSPCPNDTFIFYALVHNKIQCPKVTAHLMDIEELNTHAFSAKYDITKMSCFAYGKVANDYTILRSGAALGEGCGPLLVSSRSTPPQQEDIIAIPGEWTTANLLLKTCLESDFTTKEYSFEKIMPAIANGEIDYGVIIHEGRFTYQEHSLHKIYDLGDVWQQKFSCAIPLGIIAIKRNIPSEVQQQIQQAICDSIDYARRFPEEIGQYIRENAQELEENVIDNHIDLYVNEHSKWLDDEDCATITFLLEKAKSLKLIPQFPQKIFV